MSEKLCSVGLDVGTTSTQMVVSELTVENRASNFAVPDMQIADRRILYRSPVHFTPLLDESHMDGAALRAIVEEEYRRAGLSRESVDTGAIIITGETSRKENARVVLDALSDLAGDFVVATAGPDLESVLAAKGAGAVDYSEQTGRTVLHMDIGGGTANLCLIRQGRIESTGCLNVGGRLIKLDNLGRVSYVSGVLADLTDIRVGATPGKEQLQAVCGLLNQALEMAAGLAQPTDLLSQLTTFGTDPLPLPGTEKVEVFSFSGGVADCIARDHDLLQFGDIGPLLGQTIRGGRLCSGSFMLGSETIRATVIGAGSHSAMLSGSTVYACNVPLPMKNISVVNITQEQQSADLAGAIRRGLARQETAAVIAMPGLPSPGYREVAAMADAIVSACPAGQLLICLEQDMAKALGHALAARRGMEDGILCIDRVRLPPGSFLDVGAFVGPALPVVVKTLILHSHGAG